MFGNDSNVMTDVDEHIPLNTTSNKTSVGILKSGAKAYFTAAFVLQWINTVLIITLNIAVIVTILRYKKRSRLYFLLLNLAIADLLTGVIDAFPRSIEYSLGFNQIALLWYAGDIMCKIHKMLGNVSMTSSNYILAVTSIDRAMVVYNPMINFKRGNIWQKCIIVGCWSLSFACSIPILNITTLDRSNHCAITFDNDINYWWKILVSYMFVVIFAIPFIIIVISYTILVVSIYRRSFMPLNSDRQDRGVPQHRISQVFNRAIPKTKIKSLKLTVGIVLSFIFSWSLFFIFMFLHIFDGYKHMMMMLFVTCYYWSCIANPILFFIFHRRKIRPNSAGRSLYSSENGPYSRTSSTDILNRSPSQAAYLNNIPLLIQNGRKSPNTEQNMNYLTI